MDKCPRAALFFAAPAERGARTAAGGFALTGGSFSCTDPAGGANCVSVFALTERLLFLHRLSGVLELRQRVRPLTGGEFSAEPQRGDSPSADGSVPPRGRAKGRDTCGFPSSLDSYLSLKLPNLAQISICDRCEKEVRQRIFLPYLSQTDSQCQITYCCTDRQLSAGAT